MRLAPPDPQLLDQRQGVVPIDRRLFADHAVQHLDPDVRVADLAQLITKPTNLRGEFSRPDRIEKRTEGPQIRPKPPQRDSRLMNTLGPVADSSDRKMQHMRLDRPGDGRMDHLTAVGELLTRGTTTSGAAAAAEPRARANFDCDVERAPAFSYRSMIEDTSIAPRPSASSISTM